GFDLDLNALRLVRFSLDSDAVWMTERQKLHAKAMGMRYLDITDVPSNFGRLFEKKHFSYPPPHGPDWTLADAIFPLLSALEMHANLEHFSSFRTRYYNSDTGKASSEWLLQKIRNYTAEFASPEQRALISVEPFRHNWKQASVIIRVAAPNTFVNNTDSITILGAHCDSINHENPFLPAPGADDDGSGTVTILEAYRALLRSGYIPTSPLEFHFYSAEEGGGLGSQDIVAEYEAEGKQVKGMQQFDMTAWVRSGSEEVVRIVTGSSVDDELTDFLALLVDRYLDINWVKQELPKGAGSDHMLWTLAGYQACHGFEALDANANFENIHTERDRINVSKSHEFSFEHMRQFAKLAVAFAVELTAGDASMH
ncbi:peptidase, partial [Mycena pura]